MQCCVIVCNTNSPANRPFTMLITIYLPQPTRSAISMTITCARIVRFNRDNLAEGHMHWQMTPKRAGVIAKSAHVCSCNNVFNLIVMNMKCYAHLESECCCVCVCVKQMERQTHARRKCTYCERARRRALSSSASGANFSFSFSRLLNELNSQLYLYLLLE